MHRKRLFVFKAHPNFAHPSRKRIFITSFDLKLYDRKLASSLAVVKIQTALAAKRMAGEGEAVLRGQWSWRLTSNFLPEGVHNEDTDHECDPELEVVDDKINLTVFLLHLVLIVVLTTRQPDWKSFGKLPLRRDSMAVNNAAITARTALAVSALAAYVPRHNIRYNVLFASNLTSHVIEHYCFQSNHSICTLARRESKMFWSQLRLVPRHPMTWMQPSSAT